jgi:hypothetical protein
MCIAKSEGTMSIRSWSKYSSLAFALIICSATALYAKNNPLKPRMTGSPSAQSLSAQREGFECGTYRGNQDEIAGLYHLYQNTIQKTAPMSSTSFVYDDVWVVEDDGLLTVSGLNSFDTDGQTFHFASNGDGTYTVTSVAYNWDGLLGNYLSIFDDTNVIENLSFTFNFFGTDWTSIHINANGAISFGANINPSGYYSSDDFFNEIPKIAAYLIDLNPEAGGGVYFKGQSTKATVTWNNVEEFDQYDAGTPNSLQLVLYDDDSYDVTFKSITSTLASDGVPVTIGLYPGGSANLSIMSFSDDVPFTGGVQVGFYEQYFDYPNPLVNEVPLIRRFYQNFADDYFQIVFFTNFVQTMGGFANERNIKNSVQGIGIPNFDNSAAYGSSGALESRCNMNRLAAWPTDPTSRVFANGNNFLTIMGQEAGHRWGAFVLFIDSNLQPSNMLLGRALAHWNYFADSDHSSLEGGNWEHVSGDLYTAPTWVDYFSDIDEYLFGLRSPEEVTSLFWVSSPTNDLEENRDDGSPVQGATANGTPVTVTVNDIALAHGPRIPTEANAPKDLRQAFIVLIQNGTTLSQADLDKVANFRRTWEDYFEVSLDGRITCNTKLTEDLPVAVVEGHVTNSSLQPADSITVRALERGFEQFVVSGGRYTFRFMPDAMPTGPDTVCVTLAFEAPGLVPDTLVCCIPYNSTVVRDVGLFSIISGVGDDSPIPLASAVLRPNYPNPFNPRTTLNYATPETGPVRLAIYDVQGRLIRTLVNKVESDGEHSVVWNGRNDDGIEVSSGVYFARLEVEGTIRTRRVVFLK